MAAALAALLGFLGSATAKVLVDRLLFFVALKALLITLFIIVTPIIFNNIFHDLMSIAFDTVIANTSDINLDGAMSFTGFLGWLVVCFKLPEIAAILLSAVQLNLTLRLIPFSPVK